TPAAAPHAPTRAQSGYPFGQRALRRRRRRQRRQRQQAGKERDGRGVASDLFEQDGRLHPAQPHPTVGFGNGDPQPTLLGEGFPEFLVVGTARREVRPHLVVPGTVVEESAGCLLEGHLVWRQFEVHRRHGRATWCAKLNSWTSAPLRNRKHSGRKSAPGSWRTCRGNTARASRPASKTSVRRSRSCAPGRPPWPPEDGSAWPGPSRMAAGGPVRPSTSSSKKSSPEPGPRRWWDGSAST